MAIATIAAFAVLHANHRQFGFSNASRTSRCAGLHRLVKPFISMKTTMRVRFVRQMTPVSGSPRRTPLNCLIFPDVASRDIVERGKKGVIASG
jgi:hypothetical protein